ncbi:uncharacterized protein AB675_2458 [Cyphellophora attinorum]|uniref:THO complex subunit mft1 n=1 Tax=Cyphellophora attinorum TaxID=1664694 RepID=A0A0N0NR84_9EURO|nr:uncharacterized protein AB675_2458 [Phialophora attinorum]KPI44798.1 hypothetical protein AB675_2458 [Phialophora attinorum]
MAAFTLLDPAEEDKLHATRLLPIEYRAFTRLTGKLLGPKTPYQEFLRLRAPTTIEDNNTNADETGEPEVLTETTTTTTTTPSNRESISQILSTLPKHRATLLNEFSLFTRSTIQRIHLLHSANTTERARYHSETLAISDKADSVRSEISHLRTQLETAQQTLAKRKEWDVLADKVTGDRRLRERGEQHVGIERLKGEIEELEREGGELGTVWAERRSQLDVVVGEAMRLRRQIRGEKEPGAEGEAEEDGEDEVDDDGGMPRSNIGTPRPGEDDNGGATPLPEVGRSNVGTPMMGTPRMGAGGSGALLEVPEMSVLPPADEMDTS